MSKYSEQEILRAYDEFNADKDWVSRDAHEIVAHDYLSHNQRLSEFFKKRTIVPLHLYYCLDSISQASSIEEHISLINIYCNKHGIVFNEYEDLKYLCCLGMCAKKGISIDVECNRLLSGTNNELCKWTIKELAKKLRLSTQTGARFGIMEYYAYFEIDLTDLKRYLTTSDIYCSDSSIVSSFIKSLEESQQLETIDYSDILKTDIPKRSINGLCCNSERFKTVVSELLLTRYPILTGTLNYAYVLHEKGRLQSFSKQKVKTKFESIVNRKK